MKFEVRNFGNRFAEIQAQNVFVSHGMTSFQSALEVIEETKSLNREISSLTNTNPNLDSLIAKEIVYHLLMVHPLAYA